MKNEQRMGVNELALLHMEQKYGEKFEYSEPWGDSLSGTRRFLAICKSFPNEKVFVQIENYRDDSKIFSDNYLAVKYYNETVDYFQIRANSIFGEAKIYYSVNKEGLSPSLAANASLNEFLADTPYLVVMIEVKESIFTSREQVGKLVEIIGENLPYYCLTIIVVDDSIYGTLDRNSLDDLITSMQFEQCGDIRRLEGNVQVNKWLDKESGQWT